MAKQSLTRKERDALWLEVVKLRGKVRELQAEIKRLKSQ